MNLKLTIHIAVILFLLSGTAHNILIAQTNSGGFVGSFTRMGFTARGIGSANAMVSNTGDGSYGVYNPALAALFSDTTQIDLATAILPFDRQLNMIHSHFQLPPTAGFSISLLHARVSDIDGRDLNGYHTGTLSTNEFQVIGQFALRFTKTFWGGVGIKYNHSRLHAEIPGTSSIGLDAGILIRAGKRIDLGFTVQDLFAEYRFNTSDLHGTETAAISGQSFPVRIIGGLTFRPASRWSLSFDAERRFYRFEEDGSLNERLSESAASGFYRFGARYQIQEQVTIRSGAEFFQNRDGHHLRPAAGFSLHLPFERFSPSIDYAVARENSMQSMIHTFSLRLNL